MKARPSIERLAFIARRLRRGSAINANSVVKRFEVSRKTAARDIEFLRDRLRYELEWVPSQRTYRLLRAPEAIL
ncbi:MAG: HTH domain-containing protein [Verrucomicrobia bacterium]|nr:HTH domain-containing protein [Verrucomicrobiota bacterium]